MPKMATAFDRRIVLRVMSGQRAGLRMIMGTRSQLSAETMVPSRVDNIALYDHTASCRLIATKNRYILYAEDPSTAEPLVLSKARRVAAGRKA